MISPKFVNIAREVIKYVENGGQLNFNNICKDNKCCPLGVVCINAEFEDHKNYNHTGSYPHWYDKWYSFAYKQTGLETLFFCGFDEYQFYPNLTNEDLQSHSEDYVIGYKLAQFCKKRNWF